MSNRSFRRIALSAAIAALILALLPVAPAAAHSSSSDWRSRLEGLLERLDQGSTHIKVPASARPEESSLLLAFGDSVAAGYGVGTVGPTASDQLCRRTGEAYPGRAADALGLRLVNLACSGGRAWDGIVTDQGIGDTKVASQLRQAAGYGQPAAAVITVGANDVKWQEWLAYCAHPGIECDGDDGRRTFDTLLARLDVQLTAALAGVAALGPDRIYLTGYYDPFVGSTACLSDYGISPAEAAWLSARLGEVNAKIEQVAERSRRTEFVPVDFGSRGLCNSRSLVQRPGEPGAFHPTGEGQRVIARAVVRAAR